MGPAGNDISFVGETNFRNQGRRFGIRQADRFSHIYVIGKTGTGKTTLLETLIRQDFAAGRGLALIDPHGDLAERLAATTPANRAADCIYFDAPTPDQPFGYNPLRRVRADKAPLAVSGVLEVFKKMWPDAWGVRMEHILRNALFALFEQREATLADILRLLSDKDYRKSVARALENEHVRSFWLNEYEKYSYRLRADAIVPIQNKVGALLADPRLSTMLTKPTKLLSLRRIMDEGRVLLVNLSKGRLGDDAASLLGGLLVTAFGLAALSRADLPHAARRPFFLYVDEFQSFTTLSFATMLSELRKYGVGMVLAHQYLHQLEPDVRHAVLGNAGTLVAFRLGAEDAALIAREFFPVFSAADLLALPNWSIYLKLMIDGAPSKPFSAATLRPQ
jgi:hypothetical protein